MENKKSTPLSNLLITSGIALMLYYSIIESIEEKINTLHPQIQTQNIIGDPNATDPNDTYIQTSRGKAYYTIDGKSIEDHFK